MYLAHPNRALHDLFAHKPYQGAVPEQARYLFVGLDANYDASIEQQPVFPKILEYHNDAVAFWRQNGVHHPFLLPTYSGDGQRYHRSFSRIGFRPHHAERVSFIELLHVPTVGRNKLIAEDLDVTHLQRLGSAILDGQAKHVFLPSGVARLMRATGRFPWLGSTSRSQTGPLGILFQGGQKTVYSHLHFSVYGKFQRRKVEEAAAIRELLLQDD